MDQSRRDKYIRRLSALKNERSPYESHWKEIADYVLPRAIRLNVGDRQRQGNKQNQNIIDSTATLALRTLASGMMAGLTSPARPWFRLTTTDPNLMEYGPVKTWLFDTESLMREVFNKSNLYNVLPAAYSNLGAFGTAAFAVLEDHEDVIRCYPFPMGQYCIGTSPRGVVDTMYREFQMTVYQLVAEFGIDNVSTTVRDNYERGNYDQWIEVLHVVEPNLEAFTNKSMKSKDKPYRSIYMEKSGENKNTFLREAGFDDFPILAPRWRVEGEDVYGWSPGMDSLQDVKALQLEQKRKLQAIDKLVNPPMLADTQLRNQRVSMLPGDVNYIAGLNNSIGMKPVYEINPRILELMQDIQETQARIKRAFYEDMMVMLATGDNSQMTAREVEERHQEKLLVLGPVMERLNDELLDPLIDRTFSIMLKRGMLPRPPQELSGMDLKVEYISIMAQAQKMLGTSAIERFAGFAGNLAAVKPEVLDKLDVDQIMDEYGNMLGVPPRVIVSDDNVAQIRKARQQQAAMQQMQQMAETGATVAQGAEVLSRAKVDAPNGLTRMLGIA